MYFYLYEHNFRYQEANKSVIVKHCLKNDYILNFDSAKTICRHLDFNFNFFKALYIRKILNNLLTVVKPYLLHLIVGNLTLNVYFPSVFLVLSCFNFPQFSWLLLFIPEFSGKLTDKDSILHFSFSPLQLDRKMANRRKNL